MRRSALATLAAGVALLGGAGAAVFLPIASPGCPAALPAVLADPVEAVSSAPPVQNPEEVASDVAAVQAARQVVDDATAKNQAAQLAVADAQSSVPGSGGGRASAAQSSFVAAQEELTSAQAALASDLAARDTYPVDDPMYAFYDGLVAEGRSVVDGAKRDLLDAQDVVGSVEDSQAAVDAAVDVVDQTAVELAAAQGALDSVEAVQQEHDAAFAAVVARWQVGQDAAEAAAAAADRERVGCQEDGRNRLIVAGVVAVVGGALGSYSFVQRR